MPLRLAAQGFDAAGDGACIDRRDALVLRDEEPAVLELSEADKGVDLKLYPHKKQQPVFLKQRSGEAG
jgi:hypothetical protein